MNWIGRKINFLIVESPGNIFFDEIPEIITQNKSTFRWFCTTLHNQNHFTGIFELDGKKYVIDDLKTNAVLLPPFNPNSVRASYYNIYTGF